MSATLQLTVFGQRTPDDGEADVARKVAVLYPAQLGRPPAIGSMARAATSITNNAEEGGGVDSCDGGGCQGDISLQLLHRIGAKFQQKSHPKVCASGYLDSYHFFIWYWVDAANCDVCSYLL